MSEIDKVTSAQNALFEKLGIKAKDDKPEQTKTALGQEEFLKLMTTQIKNQDPFSPMENGDFIAQMAQFSTVNGVNSMNSTLQSLGDDFSKLRMALSTNYLGHSVLVPSNIARPDKNGAIHGVLDLPSHTAETQVTVTNPETGEVLKTLELGPQKAGLVGFQVDGLDEEIISKNKRLLIESFINTGHGIESLRPSVFSKILEAKIDKEENDVSYIVEDSGLINSDEIVQFRN